MPRLLFSLLLLQFSIAAQVPVLTPQSSRGNAAHKRIGIALAGGGAKGLAHIGILQWMEEHRIPVDAVAGTSMGGLIGGMYAIGWDSAQIRQFIGEIDWDTVLGSSSGYGDLSFRRKEDQRAFPSTIEMGLRNGRPQLPAGMNAGHQVELLLERIGFNYAETRSFDQLPTPFRCVSADLISGSEIVFEDGSLSRALRATMSLPAAFAPVAYNKMLLVDGGIVNNLPADIVRKMNVETVIAVDLGFESIPGGKELSLIDVAGRSIDVMIRRRTLESIKSADVVLEPAVASHGTMEFHDINELIQLGYVAAQAAEAQLSTFAVSEGAWRQYLEDRRAKTRNADFRPEFVELSGSTASGEKRMAKRFTQFSNQPFEREPLEAALTRVTGLGPYDAAGYSQSERDGKRGLAIHLRRKTHGPPFIRPLMILDSGQAGASSFTVAARITALDFLTHNSELRTDLSFGRLNSVSAEFYQFIGPKGFFVAPRAFFTKEQQLIVNDGARLADYNVRRAGGGLDLGYNFGRFSELRAGMEIASLNAEVQIGFPILPRASGLEEILTTRWRVNTLNRATIPTKGLLSAIELNWNIRTPTVYFLGQTGTDRGDYGQAFGQILYARPFSRKWSGILRVAGGSTVAGNVQPFSEYRLGGPLRLSALEVGELRGAYLGYASGLALRELYDSGSAGLGKVYGMIAYETGTAFDSRPSLFNAGVAGIMAETGVGVVSLGFSYGESGRHSLFFWLGAASTQACAIRCNCDKRSFEIRRLDSLGSIRSA